MKLLVVLVLVVVADCVSGGLIVGGKVNVEEKKKNLRNIPAVEASLGELKKRFLSSSEDGPVLVGKVVDVKTQVILSS